MINNLNGIKSIDILIEASGHGVVNWNGSTSVWSGEEEVSNHTMPKLRGYTNQTGEVKNGYSFKKTAHDIDFSKTPLYISANCVRHHLFKDQSMDLHFIRKQNQALTFESMASVLTSISGLLRGYVIPSKQYKRKSPLLLEDLVDQLGNGNVEQFGNSGEKNKNSIFSKTTFGETSYKGYASISIEDLQFISLDRKFDRASIGIDNEDQAKELAQKITDLLSDIDAEYRPKAVAGFYARNGSIFAEPEFGIMLNQDAIEVLVNLMIDMLQYLSIRQAKGWMAVDKLTIDYNDSKHMMRIKRFPDTIKEEKGRVPFAFYYHTVKKEKANDEKGKNVVNFPS